MDKTIKSVSPTLYYVYKLFRFIFRLFIPSSHNVKVSSGAFLGWSSKSSKTDLERIDLMSGRDFEVFVASLYKDLGYSVELTPESGDQGVDVIVIDSNGERVAIQTKCYYGSVGNGAVQEVIAGRTFHKCHKGMVLTNSFFTKSAISLAKSDWNIELVDRNGLVKLLKKAIQQPSN